MSYIISNDGKNLIAKTSEALSSGVTVRWSWNSTVEAINAARDLNLVNATTAKISNAKKWAEVDRNNGFETRATQINPGEFLID